MHPSRQARSIVLLGCKKKGIEYREVPHNSLGGFTTLCVVDISLLLVKRCSISPTLTTICSGSDVTPTHSFCFVRICKPSAEAPTSKVMRLISSCCSARIADLGSRVMGG